MIPLLNLDLELNRPIYCFQTELEIVKVSRRIKNHVFRRRLYTVQGIFFHYLKDKDHT